MDGVSPETLFDRKSPGARAAGIARTKWIDDQAAAALETATQLVLLEAGFDMRALRLPQAVQADGVHFVARSRRSRNLREPIVICSGSRKINISKPG